MAGGKGINSTLADFRVAATRQICKLATVGIAKTRISFSSGIYFIREAANILEAILMRKRGSVSAAAIGVTPVRISAKERPRHPEG